VLIVRGFDPVFHLAAMPGRVTIIGGGYIAVELPAFSRPRREGGFDHARQLPLRGFDDECARCAERGSPGVTLHRGTTVDKVEADGDARVVIWRMAKPSKPTSFSPRSPPAQHRRLGLPNAGCHGRVRRRDRGRDISDQPAGIYAIGDVTNPDHADPVAIAEGHSLADQLFGSGPRHGISIGGQRRVTTPPWHGWPDEAQAAALGRWTSIFPASRRCATC